MARVFALVLCLFIKTAWGATQVSVFVSFSMPDKLFMQTLKEAARLKLPVYLKGLHENSMKRTAHKIMEFSKGSPELSLQIDPTLFEKYAINQVPAVVSDNGHSVDVIYGNIKLIDALSRIASQGESNLIISEITGSAS